MYEQDLALNNLELICNKTKSNRTNTCATTFPLLSKMQGPLSLKVKTN